MVVLAAGVAGDGTDERGPGDSAPDRHQIPRAAGQGHDHQAARPGQQRARVGAIAGIGHVAHLAVVARREPGDEGRPAALEALGRGEADAREAELEARLADSLREVARWRISGEMPVPALIAGQGSASGLATRGDLGE